MKLITKEIEKKMPAIGMTDGKSTSEIMVHLKIFDPCGSWTWYATEYEPESGLCFGLVDGHVPELGYFNLKELAEVKGLLGIGMERDQWWDSTPLSEVMEKCYGTTDARL
jgi:hypothetical protein